MNPIAPIAVVGMAGLFPGASSLELFWQNIIHKVSADVEVGEDRWSVDPNFIYLPGIHPDKAYSKRCCLIKNFEFDPTGIDLDQSFITRPALSYCPACRSGSNLEDAVIIIKPSTNRCRSGRDCIADGRHRSGHQ